MIHLATGQAWSHFTGYCYLILWPVPLIKMIVMMNLATGKAWNNFTGYCYFQFGAGPFKQGDSDGKPCHWSRVASFYRLLLFHDRASPLKRDENLDTGQARGYFAGYNYFILGPVSLVLTNLAACQAWRHLNVTVIYFWGQSLLAIWQFQLLVPQGFTFTGYCYHLARR